MPFVIKWLIKEEASIIMLSTGAIQVRYDGGTILNLECPFDVSADIRHVRTSL